MSTTNAPETSVMFSLAELATIERERVEEEARQRAVAIAERAHAERQAQERANEQEQARIAAAREAERQRAFAEAEAEARKEARAQAAVDVARIEAESRAKLEAGNAVRAHELAVLRENNTSGRARLRRALAAVIGATVLCGSAAAYAVSGRLSALEHDAQRVRDDRFALVQEHDKGMAAELMGLDRRHEALQSRAGFAKAERAGKHAADARGAIEAGSVGQAKLLAFAEALDALDGRLDRIDRLKAHDARLGDLNAWAQGTGREELVEPARQAASKAHALDGNAPAMAAYLEALDALAKKLATNKRGAAVRGTVTTPSTGKVCTDPHDPLCGLDGRQLGMP